MSAFQDKLDKAEADAERIMKILGEHEITMSVGGRGGCGSPYISFKYKDEVICVDQDYMNFDMEPEEG